MAMDGVIRRGRALSGNPDAGHWAVRARSILTMEPGRPVLDNGVILCRKDRILALGPYAELHSVCPCPIEDLGPVTLAPGLFNSHVHLELSHLAGATISGQGFVPWVRSLIASPLALAETGSIRRATQEMRQTGVIFAADVATRRPDLTAGIMAQELPFFLSCVEFFGFPPQCSDSSGVHDILPWPKAARNLEALYGERITAAGHALYSTAPWLLRAAKAWCTARGRIFSLHLSEHRDEEQSLVLGSGEFHDLLARSVLPKGHVAPGKRPVALADELGLLDSRTLAVHGVHLTRREMELLRRRSVALCLCPRSNAYIGVGQAAWEDMRRLGLRLCLGTDSLASNHDLDLWNEVRFLLENSRSHITLIEVLGWLTRNPAIIFGLDDLAGTLTPGRIACMSVVPEDLPGA